MTLLTVVGRYATDRIHLDRAGIAWMAMLAAQLCRCDEPLATRERAEPGRLFVLEQCSPRTHAEAVARFYRSLGGNTA